MLYNQKRKLFNHILILGIKRDLFQMTITTFERCFYVHIDLPSNFRQGFLK